MDNRENYGSVITEQGDLGLGVFPVNEQVERKQNDDKNDEKDDKK